MARQKMNLKSSTSASKRKAITDITNEMPVYDITDDDSERSDEMDVDVASILKEKTPIHLVSGLPRFPSTKKQMSSSNSIASQLSKVFKTEIKFHGEFCFSKTYQTAPNPTLRLEGPGLMGLPANGRDLQAIKKHSKASDASSEHTSGATNSWAMEPSKVVFGNPAWSEFLKTIVEDVSQTFSINLNSSKPRCELRILLLQGKNTTLLPRQGNCNTAAFANLLISLPCKFTGGETELTYAGVSKIVDHSSESLLNTCAMAWYNGLTPQFKPITTGHRLVLLYDLVHTAKTPCPCLPSPAKAIDRVGKVLASWKKTSSNSDAPRKIICLLDHRYSKANLIDSGMRGRDAYLLSILKDATLKYGFKLVLAHVELSSGGEASWAPRQKWGERLYRHSGYDSERETGKGDDPSRMKYEDHTEVEYDFDLSNIRELDGTTGKDKVEITDFLYSYEMEAVESVPEDLKAAVEKGKPESIHYDDPEFRNYGGRLSKWWRRSVIIVCPEEYYDTIVNSSASPADALETLRSGHAEEASDNERRFVEIVIQNAGDFSEKDSLDALRVLASCACRWGDFDLWSRAMDAFQGWEEIDRLGAQGLLTALESFSGDGVTNSFIRVLENEPSRPKRLTLGSEACAQLKQEKSNTAWILEGFEDDLDQIATMRQSDRGALLRVVLGAGGMKAVEERIIKSPDLSMASCPTAAVVIAAQLQKELCKTGAETLFASNEEREAAEQTINRLLSEAIAKWEPYSINFEGSGESDRRKLAPLQAPGKASMTTTIFEGLIQIGYAGWIDKLVLKLINLPASFDTSSFPRHDAIYSVLVPTVEAVRKFARGMVVDDDVSVALRDFNRGVARILLERGPLDDDDLKTVFAIVQDDLDGDYIQKSLVPQFYKYQHEWDLYEVLCFKFKTWKLENPGLRKAVDNGIRDLVRHAAENPKCGFFTLVNVKRILQMAVQVNVDDLCGHVFSRLAKNVAHIMCLRSPDAVLSAFEDIAQWLAKAGLSPLHHSFPEFSRAVVSAWRGKVVEPRPNGVTRLLDTIPKVTCVCEHCAEIKKYLNVLNPYEERFDQIGPAKIGHVIQTTLSICGDLVNWRSIASKPEPSLWMRKSDETLKNLTWITKQRVGLAALRSISGDDATIKQVLGDDEYRIVLEALHIEYIQAPLPAPSTRPRKKKSSSAASSAGSLPPTTEGRPAKRRKVSVS